MSSNISTLKRVRQSIKANTMNRAYKAKVNTAIKKVLSEKKKDEAQNILKETVKLIDKAASKRIIHKNKAANKKSTLYKHINSL